MTSSRSDAGGAERPPTTRLAPSPTGALHLGNARTFLITWALARTKGWRNILRIEDLDTPRVKPGTTAATSETLRWLGIDWDPPACGPADNPLVQSRDLSPYREALGRLAARGLAYPCALTRTQIESAGSAPQEGSHETPFPASLRPPEAGAPMDFDEVGARWASDHGESANWRFITPGEPVRVTDEFAGTRLFDVCRSVGDFVLWTKRDLPSYQLAVVVDDHRQGVTHIVRGDDLLDSAARQLLLYRALGYVGGASPGTPTYFHLPLVVGTDGRRLAKRHGDSRIDAYRAAGVPAEAVIGLIGHWSIAGARRAPMTSEEFKGRFEPGTMRHGAVTFTPEDHEWLLSHAC